MFFWVFVPFHFQMPITEVDRAVLAVLILLCSFYLSSGDQIFPGRYFLGLLSLLLVFTYRFIKYYFLIVSLIRNSSALIKKIVLKLI